MIQIAAIAWKDLRGTARNLPALAMMLLAPLALAALLGFAFGGGESFSISPIKVVVVNEDEGPLTVAGAALPNAGNSVAGVLEGSALQDLLDVSRSESPARARSLVDEGTRAVAVIIPPAFSRSVYGAASNDQATVELYQDPTEGIGASIVESVVDQTLLTFNGASAAAAAATALAGADGTAHEQAAQAAAARYVEDGGAEALLGVAQRPPQLPAGKETRDVGVTAVILAGMMVFFLFFGASNVARTILDEDQAGTLSRLFTTPTPRRTILGGKFVSVFVTVAAQAVILLVAGRLIFGIRWGSPGAVAALTVAAAVVASSLALLIISLVRTPGQAGAIGSGVYLILALVGGNFVGTVATTGIYATLQRLTPNGWLLRAWDTTMRGGSVGDIALSLLVTFAFALVFFIVAIWRFRKRFA